MSRHQYSITEKKGLYYAVVSYKDRSGKYKTKWIPSGIKVPTRCLPGKNNSKLKVVAEAKEILIDRVLQWEKEFIDAEVSASEITVRQYFLTWQENRETPQLVPTRSKRNLSQYTLVNDRRIIEKIANFYGDKLLMELSTDDVIAYLNHHALGNNQKKPCTKTTHKHWLKIKQVLDQAVRDGLIKKNPANKDNEPIYDQIQAGSFYQIDEMQKLFKILEGDPIQLAIHLAFFGFLRREEVCGLDWESVDMVHKEFHVGQVYKQFSAPDVGKALILDDRTKTPETERDQPISQLLYNILDSIPVEERSGPVCIGPNGKRMEPEFLSHHFTYILKKNQMKHIRLHDLRHTAITLLQKYGGSENMAKALAGHKRYGTTSRYYSHIDMEMKMEGVGILDRLFLAEPEN